MGLAGSRRGNEIVLVAGADPFAAQPVVTQQLLPGLSNTLRTQIAWLTVTECLGDTVEPARLGIESVERLIAFQAQPVIQLTQEEVPVSEQLILPLLQDLCRCQRFERRQGFTLADPGDPVSMGELQHLREELYIDQPAATLLEIES